MPITRRWDPAAWETSDFVWLLCLGADYDAAGNARPWWMADNQMELWSGVTWDRLDLVREWPRRGTIWTAPQVCATEFGHVCIVGENEEGPTPRQRALMVDPYTMNPIGSLPEAPPQYRYAGRAAWRDGRIQRVGAEWWLTMTTGGFRWHCPPQVMLYRSDIWTDGWQLDGPIVDPALAQLFAEFERPQLHRLSDSRWALIWSTWASRQWMTPPGRECVHVAVSAGDYPLISRYLGCLRLPYGLALDGHLACGWDWIDARSYTSTCRVWRMDETPDDLVRMFEQEKTDAEKKAGDLGRSALADVGPGTKAQSETANARIAD